MAINHDYLNLRKVCDGWTSSILPSFTKEGRSYRVFDIITDDESCFYHYDYELKEQ